MTAGATSTQSLKKGTKECWWCWLDPLPPTRPSRSPKESGTCRRPQSTAELSSATARGGQRAESASKPRRAWRWFTTTWCMARACLSWYRSTASITARLSMFSRSITSMEKRTFASIGLLTTFRRACPNRKVNNILNILRVILKMTTWLKKEKAGAGWKPIRTSSASNSRSRNSKTRLLKNRSGKNVG